MLWKNLCRRNLIVHQPTPVRTCKSGSDLKSLMQCVALEDLETHAWKEAVKHSTRPRVTCERSKQIRSKQIPLISAGWFYARRAQEPSRQTKSFIFTQRKCICSE